MALQPSGSKRNNYIRIQYVLCVTVKISPRMNLFINISQF